MKNLKLFRVDTSDEFYCLAKNATEAESLVDDFIRDNVPSAHAVAIDSSAVPDEWREGLLYHSGDGDVSLQDWLDAKADSGDGGGDG